MMTSRMKSTSTNAAPPPKPAQLKPPTPKPMLSPPIFRIIHVAALPDAGSQDDDQQHEKHKRESSRTTRTITGTGITDSNTHIHHHRLFVCDGSSR
jgi:hypothetical protein